jgi:hypothetical protein
MVAVLGGLWQIFESLIHEGQVLARHGPMTAPQSAFAPDSHLVPKAQTVLQPCLIVIQTAFFALTHGCTLLRRLNAQVRAEDNAFFPPPGSRFA